MEPLPVLGNSFRRRPSLRLDLPAGDAVLYPPAAGDRRQSLPVLPPTSGGPGRVCPGAGAPDERGGGGAGGGRLRVCGIRLRAKRLLLRLRQRRSVAAAHDPGRGDGDKESTLAATGPVVGRVGVGAQPDPGLLARAGRILRAASPRRIRRLPHALVPPGEHPWFFGGGSPDSFCTARRYSSSASGLRRPASCPGWSTIRSPTWPADTRKTSRAKASTLSGGGTPATGSSCTSPPVSSTSVVRSWRWRSWRRWWPGAGSAFPTSRR